jgi:hypothetical protein
MYRQLLPLWCEIDVLSGESVKPFNLVWNAVMLFLLIVIVDMLLLTDVFVSLKAGWLLVNSVRSEQVQTNELT